MGADVADDGGANGPPLPPLDIEVPDMPEVSLRLLRARVAAMERGAAETAELMRDRDRQLAEALREASPFSFPSPSLSLSPSPRPPLCTSTTPPTQAPAPPSPLSLTPQVKATRAEREGWEKRLKAAEAATARAKKGAAKSNEAATAVTAEVEGLRRRCAEAEKAVRATEKEGRARDLRLARALEDVARLTEGLQAARSEGASRATAATAAAPEAEAEVRRLQRQLTELMAAFRKQQRLVDVLKKQRLHLEAARALAFSEEEFARALAVGGMGGGVVPTA